MKVYFTVMALFGKNLQLHTDVSQTLVHFKPGKVTDKQTDAYLVQNK